MNYKPSDYLKQAVEEGRVDAIRQALQVELNDDTLADNEVMRALDWTNDHIPSLLEPFDLEKGVLGGDRNLWNEDYFLNQKVELNYNFARERFEHLVVIRNYLREQGHPNFTRISHEEGLEAKPTQSGKEQSDTGEVRPNHPSSPHKSEILIPLVAIGLVGAGIAVRAAGVVAAIGVAGVVGAGYIVYSKLTR